MQIWHVWLQKHAVMDRSPLLDEMYAKHVAAVARTSTVEIHTLPAQAYDAQLPEQLVRYGDSGLMIANFFADSAVAAEHQRYHAWISGAGQDPGLAAAQTRCSIPVVGYGDVVWQAARAEQHRLGVLGFHPHLVEPITANITAAGAPLAAYQVIQHGPELVQRALAGDFAPLVNAYGQSAADAAEAGAQWLVPAERIVNEILVHLSIHELAGLPVIDPGGWAIKQAEYLCELRALRIVARPTTGYWRSLAPRPLLERLQQALHEQGAHR
ncbi:aspartate/glutamate racemase family protein [Nonomuraea sp. NPDC049709]|uniref:aspartate/glutamate racemase family protein n=1 Tax=Nonomuraea sp. NPDC049709 TaxID=3154736 RepID=UPI003447954D